MSIEQLQNPEQLIGASAIEVVKAILEINRERIKKSSLIKYHYSPGKPSQDEPHIDLFPDQTDYFEELIMNNLEQSHEIGVSSKVELIDGSFAHMMMVDFDCPKSAGNFSKVSRRVARLEESLEWAILVSGASYHAYCLNALLPVERSNRGPLLRFAEKSHGALDFNVRGEHDELTCGWWFLHKATAGEFCFKIDQ